MKTVSHDKFTIWYWICLVLDPLFLMWCLEYLHDDLGVPMLSFWKCFWLIFAYRLFASSGTLVTIVDDGD